MEKVLLKFLTSSLKHHMKSSSIKMANAAGTPNMILHGKYTSSRDDQYSSLVTLSSGIVKGGISRPIKYTVVTPSVMDSCVRPIWAALNFGSDISWINQGTVTLTIPVTMPLSALPTIIK